MVHNIKIMKSKNLINLNNIMMNNLCIEFEPNQIIIINKKDLSKIIIFIDLIFID